MKRLTMVSRAVLALVVLASLAACNGGTFFDPGHDAAYGFSSGGGGSRGGANIATLSSNASQQDALSKVDEIIAYCYANPGQDSDLVEYLPSLRGYVMTDWNYDKAELISEINDIIDYLS